MKLKTQKKSTILLLIASMFLIGGTYLLLLTFTPQINFIESPYKAVNAQDIPEVIGSQEDYIYIDKLGIAVPLFRGNQSVLDKGVWHRFPERGDPEKGGNFILSAHRFQMGWTPAHTKQKSPFYNLDKLRVGDALMVRFQTKEYRYRVTITYAVKPDASEIEAVSETAKMTLYTCTLKGSADGRTVIEAELVP